MLAIPSHYTINVDTTPLPGGEPYVRVSIPEMDNIDEDGRAIIALNLRRAADIVEGKAS